jgi:hypothetical protein
MHFTISRPQKKKGQHGVEAAFAAACAIDALIGLHVQKCIYKKLGFGLGPDLTIIGGLSLHLMLNI